MRRRLLANPRYAAFEVAVATPVLRALYAPRRFLFHGMPLPYFVHRYNATYSNERIIELAVARHLLVANRGKRILEIGNVTSHYLPISHEVLDKFERDPHVTHQKDILSFKPAKPYDVTCSFSTLEHVGFDEQGVESDNPRKIVASIRNILSWTREYFIFTFPLGFNKALDAIVLDGSLTKATGVRFTFYEKTPRGLAWHERASMPQNEYEYTRTVLAVGEWRAASPTQNVKTRRNRKLTMSNVSARGSRKGGRR